MGERRSVALGLFALLLGFTQVPAVAQAQQADDPFAEEDDPFADEGTEEDQPAESNDPSGEALPPPTVPEGYGSGQPQQQGAQPAPTAPGQQQGYGQGQQGQQGYGQGQQSYGRPTYQQPYQPQQRPPRLQRIPYREGMAIPEGGRVVEKRSLGMIIAGGAMFLVSYGLSVSLYVDVGFSGMMLVPVVGPIIETREDDLIALDRMLLVLDGLVQGVGLTLLGLGIGRKKKILEYYGSNEPGWRVSPRLGPGGGGVDLRARF